MGGFHLLSNQETLMIQKLLPMVVIIADLQRLEGILFGNKENKLTTNIKGYNFEHAMT